MPPSDEESCRKRRHATTAVLATPPLVASTRPKSPGSLYFSPGRGWRKPPVATQAPWDCHKPAGFRSGGLLQGGPSTRGHGAGPTAPGVGSFRRNDLGLADP